MLIVINFLYLPVLPVRTHSSLGRKLVYPHLLRAPDIAMVQLLRGVLGIVGLYILPGRSFPKATSFCLVNLSIGDGSNLLHS